MPKIDFYETIRAVPANPVKQLSEQAIDGKRAIGFVFEQTHQSSRGVDTWHRTYWIDPTTKLPIRIEVTCSNPSSGDSEWVKSDFVFDAAIDESLFNTDPPAEYTDLTAHKSPKAERQPAKHAEHN
jgi:outer membrane lipoprotein-sorting protein